jgi:hypothetical protein
VVECLGDRLEENQKDELTIGNARAKISLDMEHTLA